MDHAHLNPDWNADRPQHVGVATVLDAVEGISFPIDRDTLIAQRGEATVDLTGDRPERLRVLLLRTEADRFLSVTDLVQRLEGVI